MPRTPAVFTGRRFYHEIGSHIIAFLLRLFFRFYGRWEVRGLEHIPRTGGFLIAGNHASYLDPPLGWAAVYSRRRIWGVGREDLWNNPFLAFALDCIRAIPIKRGSSDRAMIRKVLELVQGGEGVGIFPEGTRTYDGELNPGLEGIGLLALKSGVPVIPTAFLGTYAMWSRHQKKPTRAKLLVAFGPPLAIPPNATRQQVTEMMMVAIAELMTANGRPTKPPTPERAAVLAEFQRADPKVSAPSALTDKEGSRQ